MKAVWTFRGAVATAVASCVILASGGSGCSSTHGRRSCSHKHAAAVPPPAPLGYASDPIWQIQERNGEASDFVIYDHEFVGETVVLNSAGEDHVRQIAVRVCGTPFPVIIERSENGVREGDPYKYPVHHSPELDSKRREIVVQALLAMGVADADQRVVVAPAIAEGFESYEAERAYARGMAHPYSYGYGFFGGFGRGFGGSGGFSGF